MTMTHSRFRVPLTPNEREAAFQRLILSASLLDAVEWNRAVDKWVYADNCIASDELIGSDYCILKLEQRFEQILQCAGIPVQWQATTTNPNS